MNALPNRRVAAVAAVAMALFAAGVSAADDPVGAIPENAAAGIVEMPWKNLGDWSVAKGEIRRTADGIVLTSGTEAMARLALPPGHDLELALRVPENRATVYVTVADARGAVYLSPTEHFAEGEHRWRIESRRLGVAFWSRDPDYHLNLPSRAVTVCTRGDAPEIEIVSIRAVPAAPPDEPAIGEIARGWDERLREAPVAGFPPPGSDGDAVDLSEAVVGAGTAVADGLWTIDTGVYRARLDADAGRLVEIRAGKLAWRHPGGPTLELVDADGGILAFHRAVAVETDPAASTVTALFTAADGTEVRVAYRFGRSEVTARLRVARGAGAPVHWVRFPGRAEIPVPEEGWLTWPRLGGVQLSRAFLTPGRVREAAYPSDLFSDFLAVEDGHGAIAFGAVQDRPLFQPAKQVLGAAKPGEAAVFGHEFPVYIPAGATADTISFAWWVGADLRETIDRYANANGIDEILPLVRRIDRSLYSRLQRAPLVKVGFGHLARDLDTNDVFLAAAERLAEFPPTLLVHPVTYWEPTGRGAEPDRIFDRNHPNFLPAYGPFGGTEGFAEFSRRCRKRGYMIMPYTNLTAWDRDALGSEAWGDSIAALLPSGDFATGWGMLSASMDHPTVVETAAALWDRFRREIGIDLIFEDQVGARSHLFDLNPGSPHPAGYCEGLIRHAARTSRVLPMMTERGYDRLIPYATGFCGVELGLACTRFMRGWEWDAVYGEGAWRMCPFAEFLAHDKVFFYHHDLGQFVLDRWDLALCLARGTQLQFFLQGPREWAWIDTLMQQSIGGMIAGARLMEFRYVEPRVTESLFADSSGRPTRVIANHSRTDSYQVSEGTVLPPGGFLAVADTPKRAVTAAWATMFRGVPCGDGGPFAVVEDPDRITLFNPGGTARQVRYRPRFREKGISGDTAALTFENKFVGGEIVPMNEDVMLVIPADCWRMDAH